MRWGNPRYQSLMRKAVVGSLTVFVGKSTAMLNVLIKRRDIYILTGFFEAMIKLSLIDLLLHGVDSNSNSLTALGPMQSQAAQQHFSSLEQSTSTARSH